MVFMGQAAIDRPDDAGLIHGLRQRLAHVRVREKSHRRTAQVQHHGAVAVGFGQGREGEPRRTAQLVPEGVGHASDVGVAGLHGV